MTLRDLKPGDLFLLGADNPLCLHLFTYHYQSARNGEHVVTALKYGYPETVIRLKDWPAEPVYVITDPGTPDI